MRRSLLALTAGGLLLLSAACGSADPAPQPGAAPAGAPSSAAAAPASPPSAADAKACKELNSAVEATMPKFGNELGKILGAKDQKDAARAEEARNEARKRLQELAKQFRDIGTKADPGLKAASVEAAAKVEASAKDAEFFKRLETIDEKWSGTLEKASTDWTSPFTNLCAAA